VPRPGAPGRHNGRAGHGDREADTFRPSAAGRRWPAGDRVPAARPQMAPREGQVRRAVGADHEPDHNKLRQPAIRSCFASRALPGQPRYATTCPHFATRRSGRRTQADHRVQHASAAATTHPADRIRPLRPSPTAQRPSTTSPPPATAQKVGGSSPSERAHRIRRPGSYLGLSTDRSGGCRKAGSLSPRSPGPTRSSARTWGSGRPSWRR
jgi:hypothetical protein